VQNRKKIIAQWNLSETAVLLQQCAHVWIYLVVVANENNWRKGVIIDVENGGVVHALIERTKNCGK
jgi:hypothetical protein